MYNIINGNVDINIAGTTYRTNVVDCNQLIFPDENIGEIDYFEKTIKIAAANQDGYKLGDVKLQETLLHELAHAWLLQTGNDEMNDEKHAELLSHFARQMILLHDNDLVHHLYEQQEEVLKNK